MNKMQAMYAQEDRVDETATENGFDPQLFDFFHADEFKLAAADTVLDKDQLTHVLGQFSQFSGALPRILIQAHENLSEEAPLELKYELLLNLAEESGYMDPMPGQYGISHHDILGEEVKKLLDFDIRNAVASPSTTEFLDGIFSGLEGSDEQIFGTLVALEVSAIPEITMLRGLIDFALAKEGFEWPKLLREFFDAHISEFEVQHSKRLLNCTGAVLAGSREPDLAIAAYQNVAHLMRNWWGSLGEEIGLR